MTIRPPDPGTGHILQQIQRLDSEQRRKVRQICFWALLGYLEWTWYGQSMLPFLAAVTAMAVVVLILRRSEIGRRPSIVILHGALFVLMIRALLLVPSWPLLLDFAILGALVALELNHQRAFLLVAIAAEHAVGLAWDPWSDIRLMTRPEFAELGSVALARVFAMIMVVAILIRVYVAPRFVRLEDDGEQQPPPAPKPSRPLTVAQWEARNPPK